MKEECRKRIERSRLSPVVLIAGLQDVSLHGIHSSGFHVGPRGITIESVDFGDPHDPCGSG